MPNKHNKQKLENPIYTFGLTTHYQLQKNFSKIELSLRQGCQLFTVYVFGSFCWLYFIRYSNKISESAYLKADFLFQDILFNTLPLLSEKEISYGETNKNFTLTNKDTINYQKQFSSNKNGKSVNIELTPFFSEKLQNYIGKKPLKSERLLNSSWKNYQLLQKKDQFNSTNSNVWQITPIENSLDSSAVVPTEHKKQEYINCKNPEQNQKFASTNVLPSMQSNSNNSLATTHTKHSINIEKKLVPSLTEQDISNKVNTKLKENQDLVSKNLNLLGTGKELIFFARKPLFIKTKTKSSINSYCALQEEQNMNIFFEKKILTQKRAYNLSGTSMIIDSEIDFLPRRLEECFNFSKIDSLVPVSKAENVKVSKGEKAFLINFKPHLTLTENVLWCETLIKTKTKVWLNEAFLFEKYQGLSTNLASSKKVIKENLEKAWFVQNSFQSKSLHLPLFFTQKKAKEAAVLVARPLKISENFYNKNQHKLVQKNIFSLINNEPLQKTTENFLLENFFLKKTGSLKNKGQFIDIFNQPRLQSGFYFPNTSIIQKNKEKLKKGLGLVINPRLSFLMKKVFLNQYKSQINSSKESQFFSIEDQIRTGEKEFSILKSPFLKPIQSTSSPNSVLEKTFSFQKNNQNIFLEWLYQPHPKLEYLSYSRSNNKLINLQKKAAQFVILDKHTDLKTNPCLLDSPFSSQKLESTFVEKGFSYKRNSYSGLLDAPENFFGTPYLKLGERFTIEKLKSKNKIEILYNTHSGNIFALSEIKAIYNKPYASLGNSLKTVFGKKQFTTYQNQNSKKSSKVQNLITNARLVTSWSKEPLSRTSLSTSWSNTELKNNNLFFSNKNENKKVSSRVEHRTTNNSLADFPRLTDKCLSTNILLDKSKIFNLFAFKRISGKANRNITLPFKYYNPGIKRERNIEDTMLILEGYKKSRLFPTIHNNYRGIATRGLPIVIDIDKVNYTDQNVDLQSILGGMRQRTEKQRIAENLSQPSQENVIIGKEKTQEKIVEKPIQQNKKRRLSNYYPLLCSLAVSPQEGFPEQPLGATNLVEYNFIESFTGKTLSSQTKNLKGSIQTKGFYFEKLVYSSLQKFPFLNFIDKKNWFPISPSFLAKILFFAGTWYSYKLLATPLSQSTQFLPATFTEAIGLQSFQQKYRIIKEKNIKSGSSFKNIAGAEKTLSELRDLIWTFRLVGTNNSNSQSNLFTFFPYIGSRFGQSRRFVFSKSRNRLLLAGPPGTGKTLLVKALAAEANLPVIVMPVSSLRMISGVENPVSALFHVARQIKPCIIFLDELDTLGNDINASTNNYTAEQKLGIRLARKYTYTLLLELDGLTSSTQDLLIIGATNRLETLNPALTRAGRFDTILDFNLPSQEVRTALFSFFLGTDQTVKENKKENSNFKLKKLSTNSFWLESYLAGKCYGLSHASIGTIINESALESMLLQSMSGGLSKSLHTLETLERAINSVKTLTSRVVQNNNTLYIKSKGVLGKGNNKINPLTIELNNQKQEKNTDSFKKAQKFLSSNNSLESDFLVNRIYQIVGSLIFHKKSQEKNYKTYLSKKTKKSFYKSSWSCYAYVDRGNNQKNKNQSGRFVNNSQRTVNQNILPINRKDLQNILLQEYSGIASLSIYTTTQPLTLKILTRAGLYQDPSYIAAIVLVLKILTLQSSFYKECFIEGNFSGNLNQKLAKENKNVLSLLITKENFAKFSGFVSESNLSKIPFSDTSNLGDSFSNFAIDNANFSKQSKQSSQTLLMDLKACTGLTTNWFRIYFSRPFFRYDTFHYIENKEYYPKNNYIFKRNNLFQRNVSTLSHTTISSGTNNLNLDRSGSRFSKTVKNDLNSIDLKPIILKKSVTSNFFTVGTAEKGKFSNKDNKQIKFSSSLSKVPGVLYNSGLSSNVSKDVPVTSFEPRFFSETKEALYLAIVASIFHKAIKFFQKNRELTDYCAYTFLRYGTLYEFYLEAVCEKF